MSLNKYFKENFQIFKFIFSLFLIWRIALITSTYFGLSILPNQDFYQKILYYPTLDLDYWARWANWDGGGYIGIARDGYIPRLAVFFPLYSLSIKLVAPVFFGSFFWAAFLISQISTILALFFLYKLIKIDFDDSVVRKTLLFLLIFPTSFYFGATYNDSLFLFVTAAAFYFARTKQWIPAAIFASLAVATKLVGVGVWAAIIFEYLFSNAIKPDFSFFKNRLLGRALIYAALIATLINVILITPLVGDSTIIGVVASLSQVTWLMVFVLLIPAAYFLIQPILKRIDFNKVLSGKFILILFALLPLPIYLFYQYIQFGSPLTFLEIEKEWGRMVSVFWQGPLHALQYAIMTPVTINEYSTHVYLRVFVFLIFFLDLLFPIIN